MPPYNRSKYKGGFCYVRLLTKRKHECKQCQKEYAKCQQFHKRDIIFKFSFFHSITPILFRMRPTHPVTRLSMQIIYHNFCYWAISFYSWYNSEPYLAFFIHPLIPHIHGESRVVMAKLLFYLAVLICPHDL